MDANPRFREPRRATARKPVDPRHPELAHREGPGSSPPARQETTTADRRARNITSAERNLGEAYKYARAAGIDRETLSEVFGSALECLTEAKQGNDPARLRL